jgi:hypothetical protein
MDLCEAVVIQMPQSKITSDMQLHKNKNVRWRRSP